MWSACVSFKVVQPYDKSNNLEYDDKHDHEITSSRGDIIITFTTVLCFMIALYVGV